MKSAVLLVLTGLFAFSIAGDARGADPEPDPKVRQETIRLMGEGKSAFAAGRFEAARQAYENACALMRTPRCLHSLALAELKAGKALDAYRHFREELVDASDLDPRAIEVARRMKDEAFAATGHIVVHAPANTEIAIDGETIERPLDDNPIDVVAGPHRIDARSGAASAHSDVLATAGEVVTADLHFEPPSANRAGGPPAAGGSAFPSSAGPSPAAAPLPADHTGNEPPSWWSTRHALGVGAIGVGLVSLGLAEVFHLQAQRAKDQASAIAANLPVTACGGSNPPGLCSSLNDELSTQDRDGALGVTFLVAGVVGMTVGAALVLWPNSSSPNQTALSIAAGGSGTRVAIRGEF
jgi:hypothetical protein